MAWLAGCWEMRDGDRLVEERWMPPRAGSMLGVGYRSTGPGQLLAWVEGTSNGKPRRIEFAYRLVNCIAS